LNRRSTILAVAAAVLVAGVIALLRVGCSRMAPSGRTVVRYCQWSGARHQPVVHKLKEVFEAEHPEIQIRLEFYPRDYWTKLLTMIAADVAPDVFYLSAPYAPDFARKGMLVDLRPCIERDQLDMSQYYDVIVQSFQYRGAQAGLPMQFGCIGVYYNKNLFDRAGVPYPSGDWTWEDLLETAKRLTVDEDGDGTPEQYGVEIGRSLEVYVFNFIGQAGADVLDETRTRCMLDCKEAVEAMQFMVDLREKHRVAPGVGGGTEGMTSVQAFEMGKVAMTFSGSWMMDYYNRSGELDYDVTALPPRRRHWVCANGLANGISARSKVKDAAWQWVKFYVSEEAQRILGEYKRGIPCMKRIANSPAFLNEKLPPENERVFLDQMASARDLYPSLAWLEWRRALEREIERAFLLVKPPSQAMHDAARAVNEILGRAEED